MNFYTACLSFGFDQRVSGTNRELEETVPVPKSLPSDFWGFCNQAGPSSCALLILSRQLPWIYSRVAQREAKPASFASSLTNPGNQYLP